MCVCVSIFKTQFIFADGINRKSIAELKVGKISNYHSTEITKTINFFILIYFKKDYLIVVSKTFAKSNYRKFSLRNIYEKLWCSLKWEVITSTTADCWEKREKTFGIKSTKQICRTVNGTVWFKLSWTSSNSVNTRWAKLYWLRRSR